MIRHYRYAWEPNVLHSATDGTSGGGGGTGGGDGKTDPPAGDGKGGEGGEGGGKQGGGDPPKDEAKFSQADLDRIVAQRLEDEKGREKKRTEKAKTEAAEEAAKKSGEWEKVAESRQSRIAELEADVERLQGEIVSAKLETVRERVAAKHKLPPALAARLQGTDEATLEADAKELAKLVAPPSSGGGTEAGAGANGTGTKQSVQQVAEELRRSGRYASVG